MSRRIRPAVLILLAAWPLSARPAAAQVAFAPGVSSFPNGVGLSATPVVSRDRRYVRLTLNPWFTALEGFDTVSVPAAVGGGGINGGIRLPAGAPAVGAGAGLRSVGAARGPHILVDRDVLPPPAPAAVSSSDGAPTRPGAPRLSAPARPTGPRPLPKSRPARAPRGKPRRP